ASAQTTLSANPISISPAYDGNNTVHVLANLQNNGVVDVPFNLVTNAFRPPMPLVGNGATVSGDYIGSSGVSAVVDKSGTLHVLYWTSQNQIVHVSYSYDSSTGVLTQLSAPFRVDTAGSSNHPSAAVSPLDGSLTVAWVSEAAAPKRILARV